MSNKISDKLNLLYSKSGYMDIYGSDLWASAIICVSFIVFINYYYFANVLEVIKTDWPNQRCNPLVIPFAGFIKKPTDVSNLEFTASNFNTCLNDILKNVVLIAVQPLYFAINIIQESVNRLISGVDDLRKLTSNVREQFSSIVKQIYASLTNLVVTFITYTIKIKDSLLKVNGIITTAIYTLFGSYMALISFFLVLIDMIIFILICIAVLCMCLYLLTFIPIIGQMLIPSWWGVVLIMIAIMIPVIWLEIKLLEIMEISTPPPPGIPGCFAGETLVEMNDYTQKNIKDIEVGDLLMNGIKVTAIIQFAAENQNIYNLHGVLVTGEHRVYHTTLKWIKVKHHPESVYIPNFNKPFVYCLNTDKKSFTIGNTLFSDWDDIDEEVWEDLTKYCVIPGYLPENFSEENIHTYLDSGFQGDSTVVLENGQTVPISDVKVNDKLITGEKIVGVVKIAAHDLDIFNYSFSNNERTICGSRNIHISDKNLGIINCIELKNIPIAIGVEKFLYHFLTDSKFVTINNIRFNDYNSGIDKYLRQFNHAL